jgi:2-phospho-L-lactate/phosphoenolpyruvate guanylyltransferase
MTCWTAIVPLKSLPRAKVRLRSATRDASDHAHLVRAMRADTLAAIAGTPGVARVLVVVDRPDADHPDALVQSRPGLNAAVAEAARHVASRWPGDATLAIVADLPATRPADVAAALTAAASHDRAFVADAAGTGTTLLAAAPGVSLRPMFGPGSAARHRASGAVNLPVAPGLRTDVDTARELHRAVRIGVGEHTTAWLNATRSIVPESAVVDCR